MRARLRRALTYELAQQLMADLTRVVKDFLDMAPAWPHGSRTSPRGGGQVGAAAALSAGALVQAVALPLAAAAGIVWLVFRNGKKFDNRPQLCPEAAAPW